MRFISFLSLSFCLLAPVLCQSTPDLGGLPDCGLQCQIRFLTESDCGSTNTTCICTDEILLAQISECVAASCSIRDALTTKKFSLDACHVEGLDRRYLVRIIAIIFGVLSILAFALRCLARFIGARTWGADDSVMLLAVLASLALSFISIPLSEYGLGLDIWNVQPLDNISKILYLYYVDEILYTTALVATKISILFFYLKIFPSRRFRITTWLLIGSNLVYGLTYDFLLIFQCNPVPGAWLSWDGEFKAQCLSINTLTWSGAAVNIVFDLAVIILPMPQLLHLSLSTKKKAEIMVMFAVGLFATIVSSVRLHTILEFGTTLNATQDYVEIGFWSTIEVPVGIICACMPSIRTLFKAAFPKVFGTTIGRTGNYSFGPTSSVTGRSTTSHKNRDRDRIRVKQEWQVLRDPIERDSMAKEQEANRSRMTGLENTQSDVELVRMNSTGPSIDGDPPIRKFTLQKEDGTWVHRPYR